MALAAAALLSGVLYFRVGAAATATAPARPAAIAVTTAIARAAEWPATLSATGSIEAWQEAVIGSESSGLKLTEVRVNVGDVVRKGDILARFDDRMLRAEEAQFIASIAQAEATASQAEANQQRALQQRDSGGISEQDVLASITQASIATARLAGARAQLAAKRLQLEYAQVKAPDDGVISARLVAIGGVPSSGQALFRLILRGRLEWRGELTAVQLAQVHVGQQVQLALPDGNTVTGLVRQQAPALDAGKRMGLVYVDLPERSAARAGMYARGHVVLHRSPTLVVPAASVVIRDGRSYVFTLAGSAESTAVRMTAVAPARRNGGEVEITSGVSLGTRVVEQGAGFLDDGDLVQVPVAEARTGAAR